MAKQCPDITMDQELDYIAGCDLMVVCSAEPSSYADATAGVDLADVAMAGGDFAKANDANGRKLTMSAKAAVPIDNTGTATHVALCHVGTTTLRYITTCTSQLLTAAGTVDFPAWKINMTDPT